ncbi:ABC transporter permease subunit [Acetobacter musti]|uniref:ABC transporter permease subunit n=1 Tax=Acetobacter musti TaxID=864732 RepID=A0ABX0JMZ0_9PROT|nr:ABC transporter permease subunit [Acetobacter musti]NHN84841.1 ABC transporter permease subunit [Acetobacter musti]
MAANPEMAGMAARDTGKDGRLAGAVRFIRSRNVLSALPVLPGFLFLVVFLVIPLVQTVWSSVHDPAGSGFSFSAFGHLFAVPAYRGVLWTTLSVALWCTVLSAGLGYPVAVWLATLSEKTRRRALFLIMAPFWTSVLVRNFAWLILLGRHGPVAALMRFLNIPGGDALLFNRAILIIAMVYVLLPMSIIAMLPAHTSISRELLSAARTMGARRADIFWRIYFPLSLRGSAAAALLVFLTALGFFITPTLLGGRHDVLLGELIILQIDRLQNWHFGSALAVVIVLAGGIAIALTDWFFDLAGTRPRRGSGGRSVAVSGLLARLSVSAGRAVPGFLRSGGWEARLPGLCSWSIIVFLAAPLLAIVPMAFTRDPFLTFPPHLGTFHWFLQYLRDPLWISATFTSVRVGLGAAALSVVLSGLAAFSIARADGRLASLGILAFMVPLAVPPIVIALAQFSLFARFSMIATDSAIMLGHTLLCMPVVFTILLAGFRSYDWQLNQAAATLGARGSQILTRILLPIIRPVLVAGAVAAFLTSFDELTMALFLGGGLKTTLPKQMWDAVLLEVSPLLVAVSVVVMTVVTLLFLVMERALTRRRAGGPG